MKTLGSILDDNDGFGRGFDFLRIFLAVGIVGWHTAWLSGHVLAAQNSVFWLSEYLLVPMFFALSGFLVAGSSMRLSTKAFLLNRAARILPALTADIIFAALLIGPLVTSLSVGQYFSDPSFFTYFLNITGWMQYSLPGVFETNPSPEVNGALWTIPFEIGCYVILAGLMVSGMIKRSGSIVLLTCMMLIAQIPLRLATSRLLGDHASFPESVAVKLFFSTGSLLWPSFLIGIALYQARYYVPFSRPAAIAILCAGTLASEFGLPAFLSHSPATFSAILPLLGYLTVMIGVSPIPEIPGIRAGDYSYGLYLYHTPFLQLLIHCFPETFTGENWWVLFLAGFPLSLAAAAVSWHLFEYPVLKLRRSFAIRHREMRPSGEFFRKADDLAS